MIPETQPTAEPVTAGTAVLTHAGGTLMSGPYDTEAEALTEPMPRAVAALHDAGRARSGDPDHLVHDTVLRKTRYAGTCFFAIGLAFTLLSSVLPKSYSRLLPFLILLAVSGIGLRIEAAIRQARR